MDAAFKLPTSSEAVGAAVESGEALSMKSSRRMMAVSPGRSGSRSRNTHIRKSRSAQMKLDLDEVSSGAALSRASSASVGFSFSFTGFTVLADSKPFSDDDISEDLEAGTRRRKLQTEPTLPIYPRPGWRLSLASTRSIEHG